MSLEESIDQNLLLKIVDQAQVISIPACAALMKSISELEIDSLQLISLSVALEDSCKLTIDIDRLTDKSTLGDLLNNLKPL
ncbi:phosphopantetheine-binding protein [Polynucleobacter sp. Tro8-14-1]|jgi:acyl carrier protein|uniref:phosphopantetheine-binding protein n=1 Tax=Polynucleobacter sp. Tro8-14-1 TaxID=1758383 RepID=UPI001C0CD299|nr:phosphopantetheine-binding protein [Polynucleobacter sp. Tro8-14-1]MBU3563170.1 hypothetical protein [Polynucleobacter sp. Tro8-14-1]